MGSACISSWAFCLSFYFVVFFTYYQQILFASCSRYSIFLSYWYLVTVIIEVTKLQIKSTIISVISAKMAKVFFLVRVHLHIIKLTANVNCIFQ